LSVLIVLSLTVYSPIYNHILLLQTPLTCPCSYFLPEQSTQLSRLIFSPLYWTHLSLFIFPFPVPTELELFPRNPAHLSLTIVPSWELYVVVYFYRTQIFFQEPYSPVLNYLYFPPQSWTRRFRLVQSISTWKLQSSVSFQKLSSSGWFQKRYWSVRTRKLY
jgi:hypothetical protein